MFINFKQLKELKSPSSRIKYIREALGLTRDFIAQKYGIPIITLSFWENKAEHLTENAIEKCISAYFQEGIVLHKDWIRYGTGPEPRFVDELDKVKIEDTKEGLEEKFDTKLILDDVEIFRQTYHDGIVMLVTGTEMEPLYEAGSYVGGRIRFDADSAVGLDCITILDDGSRYFRRLIKSPDGNFNLYCLNPNTSIPQPVFYKAPIKFLAPVFWHRWPDKSCQKLSLNR